MNREQLIIAIKKATILFEQIMEKYSGLKGHLVFSSIHGQCNVTEDMLGIMKNFPAMICDSDDKKNAIELNAEIDQLKTDRKKLFLSKQEEKITIRSKEASQSLILATDKLILKNDIFVEIRFTKQLPELIFALQKDPLVSQEHSPQSRASIRIVLGTLDELLHREY